MQMMQEKDFSQELKQSQMQLKSLWDQRVEM